MKYAIMLALVIGLAAADWLTGVIKAIAHGNVESKVMRVGGIKKLGEIIVMLAAIGTDFAIGLLATYYPEAKTLMDILSNFTAIAVCAYIVLMEIVSIMENFAAIYPEANWAKAIAKRMTNIEAQEVKKIEGDQNEDNKH